jgi:thiamine pyrophosphate-dependent acetolactate synthase large subunit-like protein
VLLIFPSVLFRFLSAFKTMMTRRPTLIRLTPGSQELQTIADTLSHARKVLVIAGAGIITAAGIPVGGGSSF